MDSEEIAKEHYRRGTKWFSNLGDVEYCNCGNPWPCEEAEKAEDDDCD